MSAKVLGLVLEHFPGRDHVPFAIAITLADMCDPDGGNVRSAVARIAKLSRTSERTVQTYLRKFEEVGFIRTVNPAAGRGRPTEYAINIFWLTEQPSLLDELAVERASRKGAPGAPIQDKNKKGEDRVKDGCKKGADNDAPKPPPMILDPEPPPSAAVEVAGGGGHDNELPTTDELFMAAIWERQQAKCDHWKKAGWQAKVLDRLSKAPTERDKQTWREWRLWLVDQEAKRVRQEAEVMRLAADQKRLVAKGDADILKVALGCRATKALAAAVSADASLR